MTKNIKNIKRELQIGVMFLVAIVFLIFVSIILTRWSPFATPQRIKVIFPSVVGLKEGDVVRVSGVQMGKALKIKYLEDTRVKVVLQMEEPITLWSDYEIGVAESSMLGGYFIDIKPGTPGNPAMNLKEPLKGVIIIPGLSELGAFIKDNQDEVKTFMEKGMKIITDIGEGKGTVGKFFKDDDLYINLKDSTDSLKKLLKDIEDGKGSLAKLLKDDTVYEDLKESAESLKKTMKQIESGKGPLGKIIYDEKLAEQISTAGDSVNKVLEPVIKTKVIAGAESKYFIDSKEFISKFYVRIEPRESRYFLFGGSVMTLDRDGIINYENKPKNKDQSFLKVDLLVAYKFFDNRLTFRGGLLEGKFGGGFDYEFPMTGALFTGIVLSAEARETYRDNNIDENLRATLGRAFATVKLGNHF
ncbi:MAG: MCE family protein, partial [Planctomycetes bacterium]|nr:MCE family protein [Planctomycetota bacterium]